MKGTRTVSTMICESCGGVMAPTRFEMEPDRRPGELMPRARAVYVCDECGHVVRNSSGS